MLLQYMSWNPSKLELFCPSKRKLELFAGEPCTILPDSVCMILSCVYNISVYKSRAEIAGWTTIPDRNDKRDPTSTEAKRGRNGEDCCGGVGPWAAQGTEKAGRYCTRRARHSTRPTNNPPTTHHTQSNAFSSLVMGRDFFGLHCLARSYVSRGPCRANPPCSTRAVRHSALIVTSVLNC